MEEIWKDIPGYEGLYQISNKQMVKSLSRKEFGGRNRIRGERILKPRTDRGGYLHVALSKNGETKNLSIHRLVAIAFIPNPDNKLCVNHIDGVKKNNSIDNLEWCTHSENTKHMFDVLGHKVSEKAKKNGMKKVIVNGVNFESFKDASLYFGKKPTYFNNVLKKQKENDKYFKQWKVELISLNN